MTLFKLKILFEIFITLFTIEFFPSHKYCCICLLAKVWSEIKLSYTSYNSYKLDREISQKYFKVSRYLAP